MLHGMLHGTVACCMVWCMALLNVAWYVAWHRCMLHGMVHGTVACCMVWCIALLHVAWYGAWHCHMLHGMLHFVALLHVACYEAATWWQNFHCIYPRHTVNPRCTATHPTLVRIAARVHRRCCQKIKIKKNMVWPIPCGLFFFCREDQYD